MSHKEKKKNSNYKGYQPPDPNAGKKKSNRMKLSVPQKILFAVALLMCLATLIWAIVVYPSLPAEVGTENDRSGRGVVIFLPIISGITEFLLMLFCMYPKSWNIKLNIAAESYGHVVYSVMRTLIAVLALIMSLVFCVMDASLLASITIPAWVSYALVAAMFVLLIIIIVYVWRVSKGRPRDDHTGYMRGGPGIGHHL